MELNAGVHSRAPLARVEWGTELSAMLFLVLPDQFPNCGNEFPGDFHNSLRGVLEGRFVLSHCFLFGLLLIVRQDPSDPFFIPTGRKLALLHRLPFRC